MEIDSAWDPTCPAPPDCARRPLDRQHHVDRGVDGRGAARGLSNSKKWAHRAQPAHPHGRGKARRPQQHRRSRSPLTGAALKILNEEYRNQILASVRSTRLGVPEDIAAMVAFLFSDDAAYVNGQTILVDGGANLT